MKQVFFILLLLSLFTGMRAQSLIDEDLQRIASGALAEGICHCPEDAVRYAGVVVTEVSSGNVVANVSLLYKNGEFVNNPNGNKVPVPTGLGRSVLYLAMMPEANPYMVVDTQEGLYVDSAGYTIEDHNHRYGGYGVLDMKRAFDYNSNIGILKCAEIVFGKDMHRYAEAINKTGVSFGAKVPIDYTGTWNSHDILGYTRNMTLLQQVCWLNAVAGGKYVIRMDNNDPDEPYDEILNHQGLDSLRSVMRETVTGGMGLKMNSEEVPVAGITNTSPKDSEGFKGLFAAGFFPYDYEKLPEYTIGVYIQKHWKNGFANPSYVARKIINWMVYNKLSESPYFSYSECESTQEKNGRLHPAER